MFPKFIGLTATARLALCAATIAAVASLPAAAARAPGVKSVWLSNGAIEEIYAGKTWIWKEGGGYFGADGRFAAWSRSAKGRLSHASGNWYASHSKLCFRAEWNDGRSQNTVTTCFSHRLEKGHVFQRRIPDGKWYVFRHAKPRKSDEARKLKQGDRVSKTIEWIKRRLAGT